jgi:uncharacterized membrane protein
MEKAEYVHSKKKVNVGVPERIFSVLLGANMLLRAKRPGLFRLLASGYLMYRGFTGHCAGYAALGKAALPDTEKNINIRTVVRVNKSRQEVYAFWRRLENLPLFMQHLKSVYTDNAGVSEWTAKIPGGLGIISWKAKIVNEVAGEVLGWSSLPGADIENAGKVEFRDTEDGGTELHVTITYRAPFGDVGTAVANMFSPLFEKMVRNDVENYKIYIEKSRVPFVSGDVAN